jgi:hypothetical protein
MARAIFSSAIFPFSVLPNLLCVISEGKFNISRIALAPERDVTGINSMVKGGAERVHDVISDNRNGIGDR